MLDVDSIVGVIVDVIDDVIVRDLEL